MGHQREDFGPIETLRAVTLLDKLAPVSPDPDAQKLETVIDMAKTCIGVTM